MFYWLVRWLCWPDALRLKCRNPLTGAVLTLLVIRPSEKLQADKPQSKGAAIFVAPAAIKLMAKKPDGDNNYYAVIIEGKKR